MRCHRTNFITAGSQRKMGSIFSQLSEDSSPGWLGGKRESYLCAMPSPVVSVGIWPTSSLSKPCILMNVSEDFAHRNLRGIFFLDLSAIFDEYL